MLPLKPDFETFCRLAGAGGRVPIWTEVVADEVTPISVLRQFDGGRGSFLLESVIAGERVGRYSFLGQNPFLIFSARDDRIVIRNAAGEKTAEIAGSPVAELRRLLSAHRTAAPEGCPPFCGGAVGYFGYDFARQLERLTAPRTESPYPDVFLMFYDSAYIFDHLRRTVILLCNVDGGGADSAPGRSGLEEIYRQTGERIAGMARDLLDGSVPALETGRQLYTPDRHARSRFRNEGGAADRFASNFTPEEFCQAVLKAKEYIFAGDIFQVVLSQKFRTSTPAGGIDLYRALRYVNPSPYMFYLDCGGFDLIGSSPEAHVKLEGDRAAIRPIAGTRPRGGTVLEDQALAEELRRDEKENAEHIMLVDLARNDLGRVCRYGTVQVAELMAVERYSHVMHLVSEVTGRLRENEDALSLLCATFPAGTVSGAPKVRAMEIISELEPEPRGPYAGALGYLSFQGNMDTAIIIRTMIREAGEVSFQVGAGIVADSDPEREYLETGSKARAMMNALRILEDDYGCLKRAI